MSGKVLVTGAAGFIGSRLVERLNFDNRPCISVDALDHFTSRAENRGIDFGQLVSNGELFDFLGNKTRADISSVIHIGAISSTLETDWKKLEFWNLEYSKKLWGFCANIGIPFIYASSAATYGDGSLGFRDDESTMRNLVPLNLYGESKKKFDDWVLERKCESINCPPNWVGFKFFNVYGYGERHKGSQSSVVVHAFDQIRKSGRMKLFRSHRTGVADGMQSRDFIFVDDIIDATLFTLDTSIESGIYNLGTGKARSFLDLAKATFQSMDREMVIDWVDTPEAIRERYQYFTQAEMGKLRAQGYRKPFTKLETGVSKYVERLKNESR